MSALAPWIGALFAVAACYALGSLFLARLRINVLRAEKPPLAFTMGAALLHLIIFAILALHVAYKPVLIMTLSAILAAALWTGDWRLPARVTKAPVGSWYARILGCVFFAVAGTFTVVYIFNAWAPEISPDGSSYHLPLIARYLRVHGFEPVPTNMYATLSGGVELIFLPAFSMGGGSAAALVHLAFLIALALAVRAYGHRSGHGLAGDAAALLMYLSPVVGVVGTTAYVDLATAAVVFSTFYWTQLWDEDRRNALLICAGLLGGYCYAAKYTAALMAVYAAGFVLWKTRTLRPVAIVAMCTAIMVAPWMIKDAIYVQNPIAPFGNKLFRNPYIRPEFERTWLEMLRTYFVKDLSKVPWMVFVSGKEMQNPLGPVFLALPLGLLALRKKEGRRVLLPAALLLTTYPMNIATRFLLPELPFLALALALACEEVPPVLLVLVLFHAVASWPRNLHYYVPYGWVLRRTPIKAALRIQSEDSFLSAAPNYRMARLMDRVVPAGEKVFTLGGVAESYTSREILVSFLGPPNQDISDVLQVALANIAQPSRALVFRFPDHPLRGIRVVQTAAAPKADELWSVHEFRIFRNGIEVPRSAAWRLRAFPNPWGVGYAFDNSEVTRWTSWETAAPGMYIDVEFGSNVAANEVRIETSTDNPDVRLRLEELGANGKWTVIGAAPEEFTMRPEGSLRLAAAHEFRAHGVRYFLVRDTDWGTEYYSKDPASWNFTPVARTEGATIYKVGP